MKTEVRAGMLVVLCLFSGGCRLKHEPIKMQTRVIQEMAQPVDTSPIVEMPVGHSGPCATKVAIIDVDGLILNDNRTGLMSWGTNPVADFRAKLDYARRHPDLRAIVVRINSPGGGVTACDIMWRDLERFKQETGRPVIVSLMDVGAGGAYYLATAGDVILAHPTTVTGGIGVIFNAYNMEDFLSELNIIGVPVKAGSNIDIGSPLRQMPEKSRDILQAIADDFQDRFHQRIADGRDMELEGDEEFLDGRILTAQQALDAKLIDGVAYLDEAISLAAAEAGCPTAKPMLLHRCRDRAETPYAITAASPATKDIISLDVPGLSRADLPTFLYLWQPNPSYAN